MTASDSCIATLCADAGLTPAHPDTRLSRTRLLQLYATCIFLSDTLTSFCAIFLVELLHTHSTTPHRNAVALAAIGGALTAVLLSRERTRTTLDITSRIHCTASTLRASITSLAFLCAIDLTLHLRLLGAHAIVALVLLPVLLTLERLLLTRISKRAQLPGHTPRLTSAQRVLDITLSAALLFLLAPLFLLIAIAIRLDSSGPSFFFQERVGRHGRLFRIIKFRSMFTTAPRYAPSPTRSADPRITGVGRILRRLSLDELPQLINVLRGDMSLVGPRPEMPFLVARHRALHHHRLHVRPGITGLWQLSPHRPRPIHENLQHDLRYIRHGSLYLDLAILIHTLFRATRGGI